MIKVEKLSGNVLELVVTGEDHTLGNLIAKTALTHPNVHMAAYTIDHPLVTSFRLTIVTDGSRSPIEVLKEIIDGLIELTNRLISVSDEMLK